MFTFLANIAMKLEIFKKPVDFVEVEVNWRVTVAQKAIGLQV